ncbi:hypothetical protein, partial [Natrinema salifodinae]|uniref:hypothetical protein n=1 Tax=Natrinema salifodinae TaxID=1202768 RepID=UPI0009DE7687
MRRSLVIATALFVLAIVFVAGPSLWLSLSTSQIAADDSVQRQAQQGEQAPEVVTFEDSESGFWEYLSPTKGFQKRSPINVIVRGDVDDVERILTEAEEGEWSEINESEEEALPETYSLTGGNESDNETDNETPPDGSAFDESAAGEPNGTATNAANESADNESAANETEDEERRGPVPDLNWGEADGGTRYAYIDPGPDERGYWTTETRQLEQGDYYGQRYHIRLYESPNEDDQWVAMQTHTEHFDWFTLRHRVHGSQSAQTKVESDFMSHPRIDPQEDVQRMYLGNRNSSDADGWATLVDLTSAGALLVPAMIGIGGHRRRRRAASGETTGERLSKRTPSAIDDHLTDVDRRRLPP